MKKGLGQKKLWKILPAILVVILVVICVGLMRSRSIKAQENKELLQKIEEMENKKVEVEAIREEVKQISKYSTYEFSYTSVMCHSDQSDFKGFKIPLTDNKLIATIEGKMNIGIDGEKITFSEISDAQGKVIRVELKVPHSEILDNYTIQDTLKIYDEKNNIFNPVKVEDYNELVIKAEADEREKVLGSDILQKADDTIKYLLISFFRTAYGENVEIQFEYFEN